MSSFGITLEPATVASQILAAMQQGNLAKLESGLTHAECLASQEFVQPPDTEEHIELLEAVALQLREALTRFGRDLTPHIEGFEVHLGLLKHLSGVSAHRSFSASASMLN